MEKFKDFKTLLEGDLREYQQTGNVLFCNLLSHLLSMFERPNLITSDEECMAMLIVSGRDYYYYLGEVYLNNGMEALAIQTDELRKKSIEYIETFKKI
ncbi:MAG: hypothetical protein WC346_05750 [Methanogenium sp.]|jgi:hypothetical protein